MLRELHLMAAEAIENYPACARMESDKREAAAKVVFDELQSWSREHMPMGATESVSKDKIRQGLEHVRRRVKNNEIACGIDPITVLTVVSALFSIVSKLVEWWNARGK